MDRLFEEKAIKSSWESPTFDMNVEIVVLDGRNDATDVGSASISPSGRDVAIASKTGLDIIDLDSPLNQPRHLRHNISWNVADVQWSPFGARDYWVASTANQKALIWNLNMQEDSRQGAIEHTLHAHTRAITDLNFSAHHLDILATCAVDGYVHAWDLRRPKKPVMTFVDWDAGATQVKWNRQDQHVIASSHDRYLRIWDDRYGAYPVKSIEAHTSKIYGVDWNRTRAGAVVTCSLDKTIKFWDYTLDGNPLERTINCDYPVWRARHTPFPYGLLAMPQTPGDLCLYDIRPENEVPDELTKPVAQFVHGEHSKEEGDAIRIKEFLWRSRGTINEDGIDEREFQLVSWGDDKKLELQRVANARLEEAVGYVKGRQVSKTQNFTRKGAVYKTFRNIERAHSDKKSATISGPKILSSSHEKNSYNLLSDEIKKMSPTKRFRGTQGKGSTMRGKTTENERRNQISWMSGIKFNSGIDAAGSNTISNRRLSVISPNFDTEADWDTPESLHQEIIRLHGMFSKVKFDTNVDKKKLTVSMNGPWGEGGESVYLKTTIRFPDHYPGAQVPTFEVGKSTRMANETYEKITKEVAEIAENFVTQRRGCLEATICYLLGELDLEESQSWLKSSENSEMIDDGLVSSSESDDDDNPGESSTLISASQELDPSTDGLLIANRKHANVPLPRLCGARFSSTGKLVCFFPPKEDKFKSLLGSMGLNRSKDDHEPAFNTFSRLALENLPKRTIGTLLEASDHESDSSGDGSDHESDSSDSDSSQFQHSNTGIDFWKKVHSIHFRKGLSTNRSTKSSAVGTGTNMGSNATRGKVTKSKNTVALHDLSGMLPAKIELGREYALYGEGADVCEHNAAVAKKHGYQDLADIWTYAGMLLQHEVPLAVLNQSHRREPILVVARDMIKRTRKALRPDSGSDSGVDVSYSHTTKDGLPLSGRVKWGYSPLAKQLIGDLFTHFSQAADCQMLAMLSCIFTEPSSPEKLPNLDIKMTQPQTPLSMKTPAFSLDYFPSDIAAWNTYTGGKTAYSSIPGTPVGAPSMTPVQYYGSLGSSNGLWGHSDPTSSFSAGNTPPLRSRGGSIERMSDRAQAIAEARLDKLQPPSQTHSLSTSPEDSRSFRRANSGIAATFAANLKNPFVSSVPAPSSPPNTAVSGKSGKRPSPVESMVTAMTPSAVTWGNTTYLESVREKVSYPTTPNADEKLEVKVLKPVTGISVKMWNQGEFDDEGCISIPLLETKSSKTVIYTGYRRLYAELLFAWQLPYTRLEILKFDSMPENSGPAKTTQADRAVLIDISEPPVVERHLTPTDLDLGLSITAYCLKHESRLSPLPITPSTSKSALGGAVGRCERCDITKLQLRCVICAHPITADYVACLSCGCASHTVCAEEYFGQEFTANSSILNTDGEEIGMRRVRKGSDGGAGGEKAAVAGGADKGNGTEAAGVVGIGAGVPCPAGCDCECLTSASKGVVESWEVMMGALEVMRAREAKEAARALRKYNRQGSRGNSRSNSHARMAPVPVVGGGRGEGRGKATREGKGGDEGERARRGEVTPVPGRVVPGKAELPGPVTAGGLGLGRRLGQVRAGEGLQWVKRKSSSLRGGEAG